MKVTRTLALGLRPFARRFKQSRDLFLTALAGWARELPTRVGVLFRLGDGQAQSVADRVLRFAESRLATLLVLFLIGAVVFVLVTWDWQQTTPLDRESGSTTIRNLGLVIGGVLAAFLAIWRSRVAERQANAAHRQVRTAHESLLNERYKQGAEMLGNDVLAVRLGGIYALESLATEHADRYHLPVTRLLSAFVRHPTLDERSKMRTDGTRKPRPREDVEAAIRSIAVCQARRLSVTDEPLPNLSLHNAHLSGANLRSAQLSRTLFDDADLSCAHLQAAILTHSQFHRTNMITADLDNTDLTEASFIDTKLSEARFGFAEASHARFVGTDLHRAWLAGTNLSGARLFGANLTEAVFLGANLSGADFSASGNYPAKGLTQEQLNEAEAEPSNPPKLGGVVDAKTGEKLVWLGRPLDKMLT